MSAVFTAYREMSHDLLVEEALRLRDENSALREFLTIYIHAHNNGSSVRSIIDSKAREAAGYDRRGKL